MMFLGQKIREIELRIPIFHKFFVSYMDKYLSLIILAKKLVKLNFTKFFASQPVNRDRQMFLPF